MEAIEEASSECSSTSAAGEDTSSGLLLLSVSNLAEKSSSGQRLPLTGESDYIQNSSQRNPMLPESTRLKTNVSGDSLQDFDLKPDQCCHTGPSSLTSATTGEGDLLPGGIMEDQLDLSKLSESSITVNGGETRDLESSQLEHELQSAKDVIKLKDVEITKLSRIRQDVESELEDLTASLFEEAHKMVRDANVKQAKAEKGMVEANMKIEGLETEVAALKTLVLTSTPSQPNKHLHPQIDPKKSKRRSKGDLGTISPPSSAPSSKSNSLNRGCQLENGSSFNCSGSTSSNSISLGGEHAEDEIDGHHQPINLIDPILRKEFISWKKSPTLDEAHPFMERLYQEDIQLCLDFLNKPLSTQVLAACQANTVCLDPVQDFSNVPRDCSLLQSPVLCKYVLKLNLGHEEDHFISQLARNRIAAVCDCINYLRYIVQGLVKSHVNDVYWELMHLRGKMALARLGFSPD